MNIVGGNEFLRNLRNLEYFKMDLGQTRRDTKTGNFKKLTDFELKYNEIFKESTLLKYGNIGRAIFYEDISIKENKYYIFNNKNEIFEIRYNEDNLLDFENYILSSMRKIEEAEKEEDKKVDNVNENIKNDILEDENSWESDDIKNGKKRYLVNQKLSKEEYRKQFIQRKRNKN